jgi:sugar lactone lactonase YvrE
MTRNRVARCARVGAMGAMIVLSILSSSSFHAQSIQTIAGGGPLGDGRPATEALLRKPWRLAFDLQGNLYIADGGNGRVRRVDATTGIITTVAGGGTSGLGDGGPATAAELLNSIGLAIDAAGNIFSGQRGRVRRVDAVTGTITTYAGGGNPPDGLGDGGPATDAILTYDVPGLAFGPDGSLYIADGRSRVRRIDKVTRIISTVAGTDAEGFSGDGGPAVLATFSRPKGLAFDAAGHLYVADNANNRVRKIDRVSGVITTVAGDGEWTNINDGMPATQASVWFPEGMTFDAAGNMYVNSCCTRVRRIDAKTGVITTIAGGSDKGPGFPGDGGPATEAFIEFPHDVKIDPSSGWLAVCDFGAERIRRIDLSTGIIDTIAGGGPIGDGGAATAGQLFGPGGVVADDEGGIYIADTASDRVRYVGLDDGVLRTIAGTGDPIHLGDGGPAAQASLITPYALDRDREGNLYVGERFGWIRRIDRATGVITTIGGNGSAQHSGDGGPATAAGIGNAYGIAVDGMGNVFVAEQSGDGSPEHPYESRVRRIDAATGIITTVAGNGESGFSGDGGPAVQAGLSVVEGIAIDASGNLFMADVGNGRVRRVDASSGIITTVAGGGSETPADGVQATQVRLWMPRDVEVDAEGDLYIVGSFEGVLRVDRVSGALSIVAGTNDLGFVGDGGPARDALFFMTPAGVDVDASGNVFVADGGNHRIRAIFACREIAPAELVSPADGESDVPSAPTLTWRPVPGAFRYDVFLSKEGEAGRTVATDLTTTSFTPQNLELGTIYFWRVRAKGDPFCEPVRESLSAVRGFITIPPCLAPPAPQLAGPGDGAVIEEFTATLAWNAVARVSTYDVYLGTTLPPPLLYRGVRQTTFTTPRLATGTTYYWSIAAHASCDTTLATQSATRSFFLAGPCHPAGPFELKTPANDAFNVPTTTTVSWSASANATSYDLYLGTTNPPAIFLPAMRETSVRLAGLDPNRTYYWRVKATIACDDAKSLTSAVHRFTTEDTCERPGGTTIVFTPPGAVGVGQTYAIAWRDAPGLDAGGTYVVERSLVATFATILDSQETATTTATFVAESPGVHYHRVRPVTRCNRAVTGPDSGVAAVAVVEGTPDIIFTIEPEAVISRVGQKLEDLGTTFAIENISDKPVLVILGRAEVESVPFFRVVDPLGGDSVFVTLQPRQPKRFELRFSGPPNDQTGAYQGLVVATAAGSPIIPYAFVNLKVGDQAAAAPEFRVSGTPAEYAYFPGLDGSDTERAPITVEIRNPGSSPMELGAEVGPEVWLEPEPGWNATPIPAGGVRNVKLHTKRNRALNGSALPRYTWFGVRTRSGETARMLVQDNPAPPVGSARTTVLDPSVRTFVVPEVVSEAAVSGRAQVSRVRLTNLGSEATQVVLIWTPAGSDGFDATVRSATIVVPPNDVATLTDPLVQVYGASRPARGQMEVRVAGGEVGHVRVESSVVASDRADATLVRIPTVRRGDGARVGMPYQIAGIASGAGTKTALVLAETTGTGDAKVTLELYDASGTLLGSAMRTVPRYGYLRIDDVAAAVGGGASLSAGRLTITVTEGGGALAGLAKIGEANGEQVTVLQASPVGGVVDAKWAKRLVPLHSPRAGVTASLVAPYVLTGRIDPQGSGPVVATLMGFVAPFGIPIEFHVVFFDATGARLQKTVNVLGGRIVEYKDVLKELFGLAGRQTGSLVIEADPRGKVYARLTAGGASAGALDLATPVSEMVTKVETARPLAIDGLEQSVDATRGSRWNLYVQEMAGEAGTVAVRLYEAGNRTHAIAEKQFALAANGRLTFETVFDAMELNTETRKKNRTNVLCVVTPKTGRALFTAVAVEIDNRTGVPTSHPLQPASGTSSTGDIPSLVQVLSTGSSGRVRPVRR